MKQKHYAKYKQLGLKISFYRKLKGMTQEVLAEKIGKETATLGAVEAPNINRTISLDTLFDIAEVLEVAPHKFLTFDEDYAKRRE
jgi:transcriptional regulator with XRE-family HTH domain